MRSDPLSSGTALMIEHTSHRQVSCPVTRPLDVIGDGWSMLIVHDALEGLTHFGELQKSLGLTKNVLAARLCSLVECGVMMAVLVESGSHQKYCLTDKGHVLLPLLVAIRQWGEDYFLTPNESHTRLAECDSGQPVSRLQVHADDSDPLTAEDARVSRD